MEKLKRVFTVDECIAKGSPVSTFIANIPNDLGINLCAVENVEMVAENDEHGQLVSMKINFIPTHDKEALSIIDKLGAKKWLDVKDNKVVWG